jgi:hypothetical protein
VAEAVAAEQLLARVVLVVAVVGSRIELLQLLLEAYLKYELEMAALPAPRAPLLVELVEGRYLVLLEVVYLLLLLPVDLVDLMVPLAAVLAEPLFPDRDLPAELAATPELTAQDRAAVLLGITATVVQVEAKQPQERREPAEAPEVEDHLTPPAAEAAEV